MKVTLIVLAGLASAAAFRNRSAALRHLILAAAIVGGLATPALERLAPAWHLPTRLSWFAGSAQPLTLSIPVRLIEPDDRFEAGLESSSSKPARVSVVRALVFIWIAGIGVALAILMAGLSRLAWLASRSAVVDQAPWRAMVDRLARQLRLRRRIRLLQTDHPTMLVTWGVWRPTVVLPRDAAAWPEERMEIVLGHELAHVKRCDWLAHIAAELLRAIYWFNPLMWIACGRLRLESEHACDDAVLSLGIGAGEYATHLVELARTFRRQRTSLFPAPAMARPSSLERRITAMLNTDVNRRPIARWTGLTVALLLATITIALAGAVGSAQSAAFSGTLLDQVGRILPNITLVLSNARANEKHQTQSDSSGRFTFANIPAGEYQLTVEKPGFATSQGRLVIDAGQTITRDVVLQIGTVQESIVVSTQATATKSAPRAARAAAPEYDACSQSTVGGCLRPPLKLKDVKPRYPAAQRDAGVSGEVLLDGRIGTDGYLKELRLTAPATQEFANAALEAVNQWEFAPTRLDGVPVETPIQIKVRFTAQ